MVAGKVVSEWVGQPTPNYGVTLTVDNDDSNFTKGRTIQGSYVSCPPNDCPYWYRATNAGQDGDMLWTYTSVNATDYWARWSPPRSGLYDVQVYIPAYNATTWGARYCLIWSYNYMPFVVQYTRRSKRDIKSLAQFGHIPVWELPIRTVVWGVD